MIENAKLDEIEQYAFTLVDCSRSKEFLLKLLWEYRSLLHEMNDPNYQYAGDRIHRGAILDREARINSLNQQLLVLQSNEGD